MSNLHKDDEELFSFVRDTMFHYSGVFNLPLQKVDPLEKQKCSRYFGRCSKRGRIHIRVRDVKKGRWAGRDEAYQIIDSMAHELAHLREQRHNDDWFSCHTAILERMGRDGVYEALRKL